MNKSIFLSCVVIITCLNTHTNAKDVWNENIPHYFDPVTCTNVPKPYRPVCGTDGKNYVHKYGLMCAQHREYGKRINLQLSHFGKCYLWEEYGISNSTILFVS